MYAECVIRHFIRAEQDVTKRYLVPGTFHQHIALYRLVNKS
jgi:hypothetical protein